MKQYEKNNYQDGIVIPVRYIGLVAAGSLLILGTVFMSGYFLGKKKAFETFCKTAERDSLADQIFVALCGVADYKESQAPAELDEVVDEQETPVSTHEGPSEVIVQADKVASDVENTIEAVAQQIIVQPQEAVLIQEAQIIHDASESYHAELIGFGTLQGAKRFAQRLEKKQIPVTVNKRVSKTAKGRIVTWYQVVTKPYTNKDELVSLVNIIKQQERLNDVRIVSHC